MSRSLHFAGEHTELMIEVVHVASDRREFRRTLEFMKNPSTGLSRAISFGGVLRQLLRDTSQILGDLALPQAFRQKFSSRVDDAIETCRLKADKLELWKRKRRRGCGRRHWLGGNRRRRRRRLAQQFLDRLH